VIAKQCQGPPAWLSGLEWASSTSSIASAVSWAWPFQVVEEHSRIFTAVISNWANRRQRPGPGYLTAPALYCLEERPP